MFTCTRKKNSFKNLTVGKEYDGTEDGNSIIVVNDAGFRARYAKEYFRSNDNVPARRGRPPRVQEAARPAPPPPPPPFNLVTETGIVVDIDNNAAALTVRLTAPDTASTLSLSINGTNISCGARQISGINGLGEAIRSFMATAIRNNGRNDGNDVTALCTRIIDAIRQNVSGIAAFLIMSDATDANDPFQAALSAHPHVNWSESNNPNSGNDIRLWVITTSNLQ